MTLVCTDSDIHQWNNWLTLVSGVPGEVKTAGVRSGSTTRAALLSAPEPSPRTAGSWRAMCGPRQLGLVTTSPGRHPPGRPPRMLLFLLFFSTNYRSIEVDVSRVTFNVVGNLIFSASHLSGEGLNEQSSHTELFIWRVEIWREISFDAQILLPSPRGRVEHVTTS